MTTSCSFKTGNTFLVVYKSDYAGTNQANAVVWGVGEEIEAIIADLKAKGVTFEHYPRDGFARRYPCRRRFQDGLVQGSGRQYPASEQYVGRAQAVLPRWTLHQRQLAQERGPGLR